MMAKSRKSKQNTNQNESSMSMSTSNPVPVPVGIHWFRNGLRLHDNPCLLEATKSCQTLLPLVIIDPDAPFAQTQGVRAGCIRAHFLLESYQELNEKLIKTSMDTTRLIVIRGTPAVVLPQVVQLVGAQALYYEREPAAPIREADSKVLDAIRRQTSSTTIVGKEEEQQQGGLFQVHGFDTHTLHPVEHYLAKCSKSGSAPSTYGGFTKIFDSMTVPVQVETVTKFPKLPNKSVMDKISETFDKQMGIPSLKDLGYDEKDLKNRKRGGVDFDGGEDAGLKLLDHMMQRTQWISTFEKPKTSPNALTVDTTGLSPYVKHGCVSPRKFYHELSKVYAKYNPKNCSKPPVSLHGQLMWREYNYFMAYTTPNFDKIVGNPVARQIPWDNDPALLEAWKNSQTGYPYIDAIMTQLRETGWIHHLARHSVACFLTRGDLWQSWEDGAAHFEEYLIDADWSINNFNWQWLSCTAHFYQYFRCYSPIVFGKKTDPNGDYIRKWLPQFKDFPAKFIYEPWEAPLAMQQKVGVVIGKDYPEPIVDHKTISKSNMGRMKEAYDAHKATEQDGAAPAAPAPAKGSRRKDVSSSTTTTSSSKRRKT